MEQDSQFVVEVSDFASQVIERSRDTPVLVDFWAPWCGPCRMLGPVLEKLAAEHKGAFILAKVNTDEHQQTAAAFQVRGIPDVKLFRDGEVVDGFVGAQPEPEIRAFLQRNVPSEAAELAARGRQALDAGDPEQAEVALRAALDLDAKLDAANFAMARVALLKRDFDAVARHLDALAPLADEREAGKHLRDAVDLVRAAEATDTEERVRQRVVEDPDDVEAHYAIGGFELAAGRYRQALEAYLEVAVRQRKWRDQAARKAMLTVFGVLGVRHPVSDEFRQKLMFIY